MTYMIRKLSGELEPFNIQKLEDSLKKSQANPKEIKQIVEYIMQTKPETTQEVYEQALTMLHTMRPGIAARYNLKAALTELGPAGYPFEKFVAHIFESEGYKTEQGIMISGVCVQHEVDVIATKDQAHCMVECKFHHRRSTKSDVKVALYVYARYLDIRDKWEQTKDDKHKIHQVWIVTNTVFTSEAIKYGLCKQMTLVSWTYPQHNNLAQRIDRSGLHPITALTTISSKQKKQLIHEGLILCRDVEKSQNTLTKIGLKPSHIQAVIKEAQEVCTL